ncbi:MAG: hypothetical protein JXR23_04120 [Pontiellaceae bacterium]|nr:hypothetical protein [Pontiellaceae bacterium]
MKKIIGIILMLVAANSFAGKIPEAKSLHPELYTIQFTYAWFPSSDDSMISDKECKRADEEYEILLEELMETDDYKDLESDERAMAHGLLYARVWRKAKLNHIESCKKVEYKDLATIYTRSGESFPEAYSNVVKGFFDAESSTLVFSEFESEYMNVSIKCAYDHICVNEWIATIESVGAYNNGTLLIKCYPPTNESSSQKLDPAVKMSGDAANEQGSTDQH